MANSTNKRKTVRKPIERYVWIDLGDGAPATECRLSNMSDTGAKLVLPSPRALPANFILRLSKDGRVAHRCRLAWSLGSDVGVAFTARLVTASAGPV
jgi:hypothetical protein